MSKNKTPMPKAKKDLIAGIIWLAAGIMFVIAGAISLTIIENRTLNLALGIVFIVCGAFIVGAGIFLIIKNKKLLDKEKIKK